MPFRFEWFIALRYLRGKRRTRFINLITIISIAGVSVGVTALIVVMSVMTGFDIALRDIIIGNRAHVMVFLPTGERMTDYEKAIREVQAITPELIAAAPIVQVEALLRRGEATTGAIILGVDPEMETRVTDLAANLTRTGGRSFGIG
ncbi:MAG TPA: ABC transporter permease, partial [Candidatus Hydrogenedentes bacterium]|nr:ABC transporter permease [Candidatus Hydrogenedentota bacterium]